MDRTVKAAVDKYHEVLRSVRSGDETTQGRRKARPAPRETSRPASKEVPEGKTLGKASGARRRPVSAAKHTRPAGAVSRPVTKKIVEAPARRERKPVSPEGPVLERLQKFLAQAGIASRRHAEDLILEGAVTVNGAVAELGCKVDPSRDFIKVHGKPIRLAVEDKVCVMLNKPRGFITTMDDPEARDTVMMLLKGLKARVKPVGRLDVQTEGLLLFTNDGDLANSVTHPAREMAKTYRVKVDGVMDEEDFEKLRHGVKLADGMTAPAVVKPVKKTTTNSWIEITIHEGRNRQVRRMCEKLGHSVLKLKRVAIGPLSLGQLPLGAWRFLSPREVQQLRRATG